MNVILGLGSNLGNKIENLIKAIHLLKDAKLITNITYSAVYRTKALILINSPKSWDKDYFNIVIGGDSKVLPYEMLNAIKEIEQDLGRNLEADRWSPRTIDIDILAYKGLDIDEAELTIPHKLLFTRKWAIVPFFEISPNWEFLNNPLGYKAKLEQIIKELKFDDSLFIKIGRIG